MEKMCSSNGRARRSPRAKWSAAGRQLQDGVAYNNSRRVVCSGLQSDRQLICCALLCPGAAEVWAHVLVVWPGSRVFPLKRFGIFRLEETDLCCAGRRRAALCRQEGEIQRLEHEKKY